MRRSSEYNISAINYAAAAVAAGAAAMVMKI